MDSSSTDNSRRSARVDLLIAIASGILAGLATYLLKIGMNNSNLALDASISLLLLNSLVLLAAALVLSGFLLLQKALHRGHVAMVIPIQSGLGIAIPIILGAVFLNEAPGFIKEIGIVFILLGVVILGRKQ